MWAMAMQVFVGTGSEASWISQGRWALSGIGLATILLEIWMLAEAASLYPRLPGSAARDDRVPADGTVEP